MWLKLTGGVFVLATAFLYCRGENRRAVEAVKALELWIALLTYIRGQIACFGKPIGEILAGCRGKLWITDMECSGRGLIEAMKTNAPHLPGESGGLLLSLSKELGSVWRMEQLERIDHYLMALEKERAAATAKLGQQLKLRMTLSLCGTMGVLLLIW